MVARRRQWKHRLAIAERNDGNLPALEALLDEQPGSGLPELVDGRGCRGPVVRDDDSFSRGEAVELDHTGALRAGVIPRRRRIVEHRRPRRRNAGGEHHLFGEGLRGLDSRGRLHGPEAGNALLRHPVREALGQRRLRSDHDQVR